CYGNFGHEKISAEAQKPSHNVDCASEWVLPHRHSNWPRLIRRRAYAFKFIANLIPKRNSQLGKELLIDVPSSAKPSNVRSDSSRKLTSQKNGVH
ncbi:hypothetical protein HN011_000175, partial [Eciton burchellii]